MLHGLGQYHGECSLAYLRARVDTDPQARKPIGFLGFETAHAHPGNLEGVERGRLCEQSRVALAKQRREWHAVQGAAPAALGCVGIHVSIDPEQAQTCSSSRSPTAPGPGAFPASQGTDHAAPGANGARMVARNHHRQGVWIAHCPDDRPFDAFAQVCEGSGISTLGHPLRLDHGHPRRTSIRRPALEEAHVRKARGCEARTRHRGSEVACHRDEAGIFQRGTPAGLNVMEGMGATPRGQR